MTVTPSKAVGHDVKETSSKDAGGTREAKESGGLAAPSTGRRKNPTVAEVLSKYLKGAPVAGNAAGREERLRKFFGWMTLDEIGVADGEIYRIYRRIRLGASPEVEAEALEDIRALKEALDRCTRDRGLPKIHFKILEGGETGDASH
jgi:hypothetical protein